LLLLLLLLLLTAVAAAAATAKWTKHLLCSDGLRITAYLITLWTCAFFLKCEEYCIPECDAV
jgi:hypothetical protein